MKTITLSIKNKLILYLLFAVCAFSSVIVFSSRSYAITDVSVTPIGSANWCINGSNVSDATITCNLIQNLNNDITVVANNMDIVTEGAYYTDTILDVELTFYRNSNSTSTHAGVNGIESLSSNWALMSYEYQQLNSNTGVIHLYLKSLTNNNNQHILVSGHQGFFYVLQPLDRVTGANVGIYAINNTQADYSSIVNAIQSQPNYTSNLNNIQNGLNNVNNNLNQVQDSIDQSNQDAEDRYQDEKDTIEQNGEDAQDTGESIGFDFSLINPFNGVFNGFTDTCDNVTFPTIGVWLNLPPNRRYFRPWWCKTQTLINVRANITAVMQGFSVIIAFAIIWKWFIKPKGESG